MIGRKRLSELTSPQDIPSSAVTGSCTHCPLYTAIRTTHGIKGSMTLVLGAPECVSYVSDMGRNPDTGACPTVTVMMDWNDMTFGAEAKLREAFSELMEEYSPEAVFLVTTCIPEITNEDVDTLSDCLSAQYGIPVAAVHTAHYRQPLREGTSGALAACAELMAPSEPNGRVNLLGESERSMDGSELYAVLKEAGVELGVFLPHCDVRSLSTAAGAALNLVVNPDALALAERMERRFGTPWFYFAPHPDPDAVLETYRAFFERLGKPLPASLAALHARAGQSVEAAREAYGGGSFFLGAAGFPPMELSLFLAELSMEPLLLSTDTLPVGSEREAADKLLKRYDPLVVNRLDRADLDALRAELRPTAVLGLRERHGRSSAAVGFEAVEGLLRQLAGRGKRGAGRERGRGGGEHGRGGSHGHGGRHGENGGRRGGREHGKEGRR